MKDEHGDILCDLTPLVKPPRAKAVLFGFILRVRDAVAIGIGFFASIPFAMFLFGVGWYTTAFLTVAAFMALSVGVAYARPDGQSILGWTLGFLRGRIRRVRIDDEPVRVYSGVCPAYEAHTGEPFTLQRSADEVHPDNLDDNGRFIP